MSKNRVYILSDFNQFHDEKFIDYAYQNILGRNADPDGQKKFLEDLRRGHKTKTQILCDLRFSNEGKKKNVTILGLTKRNILYKFLKIPILGYMLQTLQFLFRLPIIIKHINALESNIYQKFEEDMQKITALQKKSEEDSQKITALQKKSEEDGQKITALQKKSEKDSQIIDENFILLKQSILEFVRITEQKVDAEDIEILYDIVVKKMEKNGLI